MLQLQAMEKGVYIQLALIEGGKKTNETQKLRSIEPGKYKRYFVGCKLVWG